MQAVWGRYAAVSVVVAVLAACGGGGGADGPGSRAALKSVVVMGDSLSDSGVFRGLPGYGRIFSVQGSDAEPNTLWTERIAALIGAPQLCNVYRFTGTTFTLNPQQGCTSFAVGGGRINNTPVNGGAEAPFSIIKQMRDAVSLLGGGYRGDQLLLIDGGGNDAADLVGAYLKAASDGGVAYQALLLTLLSPDTVASTLGQPNGAETAGGLYMVALANRFADAIQAHTLDRGAQHVAILNMPGITNTPRFQAVLGSIEAARGATARAQAEALFNGWVQAFNQQLAQRFANEKRVAVVDFYSNFNDEVANPAQYGLVDAKTPVCPVTGIGSDGLPTYNFETCTASALSANPPAGQLDPNWWTRYAFSDGFHPTPYGHQLMSQLVVRSLAQAGWL
jgi:phospholipase/lecithinase/hemolysin